MAKKKPEEPKTRKLFRNYTSVIQVVYGISSITSFTVPPRFFIDAAKVGRTLTLEEGFEAVKIPVDKLANLPLVGGLVKKALGEEAADSKNAIPADKIKIEPERPDPNPFAQPTKVAPKPVESYPSPEEPVKEGEPPKKPVDWSSQDLEEGTSYFRAVRALEEGKQIGEIPSSSPPTQPKAVPEVHLSDEELTSAEQKELARQGIKSSSMGKVSQNQIRNPNQDPELADVDVLTTGAVDPITIKPPGEKPPRSGPGILEMALKKQRGEKVEVSIPVPLQGLSRKRYKRTESSV